VAAAGFGHKAHARSGVEVAGPADCAFHGSAPLKMIFTCGDYHAPTLLNPYTKNNANR
jgi:hypothetical protein